jgi:hypothetical protein
VGAKWKRQRSKKLSTVRQTELFYTRHTLLKTQDRELLTKLKLNSMWEKLAENTNKHRQLRLRHENVWVPFLFGIELTTLIFQNDDVAWLSWRYTEENMIIGKDVNVAIVPYVTKGARLKLYPFLDALGESVVLWYRLGNLHPQHRSVKGSNGRLHKGTGRVRRRNLHWGVCFGWPKKIWFRFHQEYTTKCKANGKTLNYRNCDRSDPD